MKRNIKTSHQSHAYTTYTYTERERTDSICLLIRLHGNVAENVKAKNRNNKIFAMDFIQ